MVVDERRSDSHHAQSHPVTAVVQSVLHEDTDDVALQQDEAGVKN